MRCELPAAPVVGMVIGVVVVGRVGEERPEQHDDPADSGPAKEEVEQQDSGDLVAAVGRDDGGQEIQDGEKSEMDHLDCLGWAFCPRDFYYAGRWKLVPQTRCGAEVPVRAVRRYDRLRLQLV